MTESTGRDRDLVLAPGEFAFILDTTKGLVNVIVGPNKVSMSNTDQPVVWDKVNHRFARCEVQLAIQTNPIAPEGFYIALYNPAQDQKLDAKKAEIAVEMQRMLAETEDIVKRAGAVSPTLSAALTTFSDQALVREISTSLAPMAAMSGVSVADILAKLFGGTPLEGVMKQLGARSSLSHAGQA